MFRTTSSCDRCVFGVIEQFYEAAEKSVLAGHVWCDQPLYLPPRHGAKITRLDPRDDRRLGIKVCGRTADTFEHAPIKSLGLASSEAVVLAKTKKDRPVVILGGLSAVDLSAGRDRAQHNETAWVVPVYGADQFDEGMRRRIAGYEFTNLFYLPADKGLKFEEGFARLDHAQSVSVKNLSKHRGLRLSPEALEALIEWYMHYSTGRLPAGSLIDDYRRETLRQLGESGR